MTQVRGFKSHRMHGLPGCLLPPAKLALITSPCYGPLTFPGPRFVANQLFGKTLQVLHVFITADKQKQIAGLVPAVEKARLYRGKGGEIMRAAVSRFIECISVAHISLPDKTRKSLLDTLNENLRHPNSQIQVGSFSQRCLLSLF